MRIGLITGEYPPLQGGVGAYTDVLSRKFTEAGHQVFILTSHHAQQQQPGIPLTRTRSWNYRILRTAQRWANLHQLDVINLQFQTAAFDMSPWVHFLPQVLQTPFVTTFHDLRFPYLFPKAGKLRDWIVMHLARTSEGVIVTNAEDYQRVQHLPQVAVIPIGSNIACTLSPEYDRTAWREKAGAKAEDFVIAHFGFLNHSKGIDILLYALAQINDPHIKLVMIGERLGASDATNIGYAKEVDTLIENLALNDQITWTGYATSQEVSAYLKAADAVVLPYRDGASYRRGSLMAAIEHECAIITTMPAVSVPDFVHGENMLLVPPDNATQLTAAVQELQESSALRERLHQGTAALREQFDWGKIVEATIDLYQQVLGAKS